MASSAAQTIKNLPAMWETWVQSAGLTRFPGGGNGNPVQYSCLEICTDRGTWWTTVHGFAKSDMTEQVTHKHKNKIMN